MHALFGDVLAIARAVDVDADVRGGVKPAHAIGGDFYDFIPIGPGRMGVLISDVSGKGASAALLMARVTSEFRGFGPVEEVLRTGSGDAEATLEDLMLVIRGFVKQAPQYDDLTTVCFGREARANRAIPLTRGFDVSVC